MEKQFSIEEASPHFLAESLRRRAKEAANGIRNVQMNVQVNVFFAKQRQECQTFQKAQSQAASKASRNERQKRSLLKGGQETFCQLQR